MIYYVLRGTLNSTHSLTHSLTHSTLYYVWLKVNKSNKVSHDLTVPKHTKPNQFTNANLIKLVNVAYEEITIASRNFGVRNVNHVLKVKNNMYYLHYLHCAE